MSDDRTSPIAEKGRMLRDLAESVIDAYEVRVRMISQMMKQAYELVGSYQHDVENMLALLQRNMAKGQSLRCCDFDSIIRDLADTRARCQQQVSERLDAFAAEDEGVIMRLRRILAGGKASHLADLRTIQEDILTRQKQREREVIAVLRKFEIQEHELLTSLRWLLDKGEKATVTHLRSAVKTLTTRWVTREKEIFHVVEQLEEVRSRVRDRWRQVVEVSS